MSRGYGGITLHQLVKDALDAASLQAARFDRLFPEHDVANNKAPALPKTEAEVDAFVKDRIRLYMSSWITAPLAEVMKRLEGKEY